MEAKGNLSMCNVSDYIEKIESKYTIHKVVEFSEHSGYVCRPLGTHLHPLLPVNVATHSINYYVLPLIFGSKLLWLGTKRNSFSVRGVPRFQPRERRLRIAMRVKSVYSVWMLLVRWVHKVTTLHFLGSTVAPNSPCIILRVHIVASSCTDWHK